MKVRLINLLKQHGLTVSSSEARRVVAQGAVRLNGVLQTDMQVEVEVALGDVLEVGKSKRAVIEEIQEPIILDTKEKILEV